MSRISPLDIGECADCKEALDLAQVRLGFVPNSMRILARLPRLALAYSRFAAEVWSPGSVDGALKALIAVVSSRSAGCSYCVAHCSWMAWERKIDEEKIRDLWSYEDSPRFSEAEKAALCLAEKASKTPVDVCDSDFEKLKKHFTTEQVVEIAAVISFFGFLNRWNAIMATSLEEVPLRFAEAHLGDLTLSAPKSRCVD